MSAQQATFDVLSKSRSDAAAAVLGRAVRSSSTQMFAIKALAASRHPAHHAELITAWRLSPEAVTDALGTSNAAQMIDEHAESWHLALATSLLDQALSREDRCRHLDMALQYPHPTLLVPLVRIAQKNPDATVGDRAGQALLKLCNQLGEFGRAGQQRQSSDVVAHHRVARRVRSEALRKLHNELHRDDMKSGSQTVIRPLVLDAWLSLASWEDSLLRQAFEFKSPLGSSLVKRLRSSRQPGVVRLLAGYIRRQQIPERVLHPLMLRKDVAMRDAMLEAVSRQPNASTLGHLREYGLPESLRGGRELMLGLPVVHDAALCQAYSVALPNDGETLAVILSALIRRSPSIEAVVAESLGRCHVPELTRWVPAATRDHDLPTTDDLMHHINSSPDAVTHRDACVLEGLIELTLSTSPRLQAVGRRLLSKLNLDELLPQFAQLSPAQRRRMGQLMLRVDTTSLDTIRDGLRHPVMRRRLEAIEFAEALALVDLVLDPLAVIAEDDHQLARIAVAKALGTAKSEQSLEVLYKLSQSLQGSVADTASAAIRERVDRDRWSSESSQDTPTKPLIAPVNTASTASLDGVSMAIGCCWQLAVVRVSDLAPEFQSSSTTSTHSWTSFAGAILTIVVTALFIWLLNRHRQMSIQSLAEDDLTIDLCRAHALTGTQLQLLQRVATAAKLDHVADLFLSSNHFDAAVGAAREQEHFATKNQMILGETRRRIFA
ncbi:MAG: hypothetical protein AAF539_06315 [Planctomycetota bacterium]